MENCSKIQQINDAICKAKNAESVIEKYDEWTTYNEDMSEKNYRGPKMMAEVVNKYVKDKNSRILDVAAGTGIVGERLKDLGYGNIDALEPSKGLAEVARKKNIYKDFIHEIVTGSPTSIEPDTYDCITASGAFCQGHIPCDGLHELLRITKPGGVICIIMRESYLWEVEEYKDRLEPLMTSLEDAGKWSRLERTITERYAWANNGATFVCKKN